MLPIPIITAGLQLLNTAISDDKKKDEEKVVEVMSMVVKEVKEAAKVKPFYQSKRWYMAILAVLIPVGNRLLGWNMTETEIGMVICPVIAYVLGKSYEQK